MAARPTLDPPFIEDPSSVSTVSAPCHELTVNTRPSGAILKSVRNMDYVGWHEFESFEHPILLRRHFYRCRDRKCRTELAYDEVRAINLNG